jgi:AcrR family transcriptional regulator
MSLRDLKRARTRQAVIDAAIELFERQGYDETTVAEIAAAAEIGARTFFSYFASKEELLFPESDARVEATLDAIANRAPDDGPTEILLRALGTVGAASDEMVSPLAALRLRLVQTIPAVRGHALRVQLEAQQQIARYLADVFPERLDHVQAAALTGAFVGAISAALQALFEQADKAVDPAAAMRTATEVALAPWQHYLAR